jgi:uncharacterized protein (DUF1330 family)
VKVTSNGIGVRIANAIDAEGAAVIIASNGLQESNVMNAYLFFAREKIINKTELKLDLDRIRATFEGPSVKVHINYGRLEVLEGNPFKGIVIAEFPSLEAAEAWYESPAF